MRIAVFVENRNGVNLASEIMRARKAETHSFHLVTADRDGHVAEWIEQEAAARFDDLAVRNLFAVDEALSNEEFLEELGRRIRAFAEDEGIDRLVFFNDQSQRGRRVAQALRRSVPLILVQDGHLDFHFKRTDAGLRDQNWYYGSSSPAAVCVWGPATAHHLMFRTADANPPVHITGALSHSDDPALLRATRSTTHRHAKRPGEALRIVVLDQPLSDQRKLSKGDHRKQLTELCAALAEFGEVEIKPHPSTLEGHLTWLRTLPNVTVLEETALLDAEALDGYDLAITFFSTTYLQTLRAGTPLVLFSPPPLNIVFPTINHPLLRNVGTVGELVDVIADLQRSGKFIANAHGEPVEHFLTFNDDVAERVMRHIEEAAVPGERAVGELPGTAADGIAAVPLSRAERALRAVQQRQRRPRSLAVLGLGFSYVTGVAIPVLTYTQSLLAQSPVDVRYFDLGVYTRAEDVLSDLEGAEVVLINSLAPFWRSPLANDLVEALHAVGRSVVLYAHETEYVMNFEGEQHALRHAEMLKVLPKMKVLCVSTAQADMFRQLGVNDPVVIYNTVPQDTHRARARRTPGAEPRIVMVGSMQDRKGLDLFSRVAELAHAQGLPWRFAWIGHKTWRISPSTLVSDRVEWMGALSRDRVREELAASDVFFLSSVDDPMPLSVVEAVQQRLRTVTYHRVGSREVLEGVPGYRSFGEYTPEAAFEALRGVLAEEVSEEEYQDVEELFDIPAFTARMTAALGLPGPGEDVRLALDSALSEDEDDRGEEGLFADSGAEGDDSESARRFAAVLSRHGRYLAEDFTRHFKAGKHDEALRVGTEILRRRQPVDVLMGMAEIRAQRGDVKEACRLLSAAAIAGGDRARVWSEVARVAALLGTRGRAIRQLARKESIRIELGNRSARLLKSD
ncbi:glycosyltransferase family 4 protein [Streptomyces spinoverrucosus]|uniref:glycosyltransferase family 4 protein n=1 Tax=Streptomyces spinoverrucosus TaxID=284043 RepID=UPI0018C3AFFB|nr:glycosyltransferase family 4 protein [Streptomyces spinoverrucosus]MBG0852981.1 glycosyltransferase family 4 protein [Streptomyces spinoverrucosus]